MYKIAKKFAALAIAIVMMFTLVPAAPVQAAFSPTGLDSATGTSTGKVTAGSTVTQDWMKQNVSLTLKDKSGGSETKKVSAWMSTSGVTVTLPAAFKATKSGVMNIGITAAGVTKTAKVSYTVQSNFKLKASSANLKKGGAYTIGYSGNVGKVTFSSNKSSVASVGSSTGLVTAKAKGSATITAKDNGTGETLPFSVSVTAAAASEQAIVLTPAVGEVKVNKSVTVKIAGVKTSAPTVSSSKSSVAKVTSSSKTKFVVKGVKAGTAKITVKVPGNANYKAATVTMSITVDKANAKAQNIKVKPTSLTLTAKKKSNTITVSGNQGAVKASSSNTKIATVKVSKNKVTVTRKKKGTAYVTIYAAKKGNYAQSAAKTVKVTCK